MHSFLTMDASGVDVGFDMLDYSYADGTRCARHLPARNCRELWCAVILQAFIDMGVVAGVTAPSRDSDSEPSSQRYDEAARWLMRGKADFILVCDLAGVSPHTIRRAAQILHGRRQLALGALCEPT